jgi:transposase-like protein
MKTHTMNEPKTLQQAVVYFSSPDRCIGYLAKKRWPKGVVCPTCGSKNAKFNASRRIWQCSSHHPKRQFSVKVGTIFEDSAIGLDKWLVAVWMVSNCKNGVSSYEVARSLGVTQKTAWFVMHRIRLALQDETGGKLGGEVEVDETYIGGLARNMHADRRARKIQGRTGGVSKTAVLGLLERNAKGKSKVRTKVIPEAWKESARQAIRQSVEIGSSIYSDEHGAFYDLNSEGFKHDFVCHAEAYVDGVVHTNGLENFWSLLKRGIKGTYVSIEPFHLFRYLDEQAFRFNNRHDLNDGDRFDMVMSQVMGKRLTWNRLTGKSSDPQTCVN